MRFVLETQPQYASRGVGRAGLLCFLIVTVVACHGEPTRKCDTDRVEWGFNDVTITPEEDVSPEPGIQINVSARTTLRPGTRLLLLIGKSGGDPEPGPEAVVSATGTIEFDDVTVPTGTVTFVLRGDNGCKQEEFSTHIFVFDQFGDASCVLTLPAAVESDVPPPATYLNAMSDSDPIQPGLQARFIVTTVRPDVQVELMVRDIPTGSEVDPVMPSSADGNAVFVLTLAEGSHAARALCRWAEIPKPRASATLAFAVDTQPPDCALTAPTAAVTPADDLDGNLANGIQFEVRARSEASDVAAEVPVFNVVGTMDNGSPIDAAGQSQAVATLPNPPPALQTMSVSLRDHAGNPCTASVVFN
jgi:hypothetical protein